MTSIERTAYPRFKRYYTHNELHKIYTPTLKEKKFGLERTIGKTNYLNLIILLKVFQKLGYFPSLDAVPKSIKKQITKELSLPLNQKIGYVGKVTLFRHKQLIRSYLQVNAYNSNARLLVSETVTQSAYIRDNPADLINIALEELVKNSYELPSFRELDRQVNHLRTRVNETIFSETIKKLKPELSKTLNDLLKLTSETVTPFNQLKTLPKRPSRNHLNDLLAHEHWLSNFGEISNYLEHINSAKIKHFADEARVLDAASVKKIKRNKRLTLLLCLLYESRRKSQENLLEMFLKRIATIHKKAKDKLEEIRQQHQQTSDQLLSTFQEVLQLLSDEDKSEKPQEILETIQSTLSANGGLDQLLNQCEAITAYKGNNYYPLLWRFYQSHRAAFFRLIKAVELQSTTTDNRLMNALNFLLENSHRRGEWLIGKVDLSFTSKEWQKIVIVTQNQTQKIARRPFEVCIFSYLASELKSGDVCVKQSASFGDWRKQLMPWDECQSIIEDYCGLLDLPNCADSFIKHLKDWLIDTANRVDEGYPINEQVIINDKGEPTLKKLLARPIPESLKNLEAIISERIPNRNLIDILQNVDYWTNFTRHFGPLSGSDPKLKNPTERYLLTIFTYGCNLGASQAARHMRGIVNAKSLSNINSRHISIEQLNRGLTDIINRYNVLDLPQFWGQGDSAAADGTKYDVQEQNLLSEYHIRYGGYGGIAYHHVADKYIALFSHFIPCGTWEAVYILEGLLQNKSTLQAKKIHGDTQGQSTPVFALSYLLGIQLMPRIRNWQDLIFYRPDKETVYKHIDSLFKHSINWELLRTHWTDLMQVVLSIYTGKISSAAILRKLGNYSRKNRLYKAFRELGRVIRTIFLLEYISDGKLRRQITAATNKVEAYHGFSKWFFFGGDSIINSNDREEMEKRIKYNDLVANAVIFQNVVDLTEVFQQLQTEGYFLDKEDVSALSPYLTSHIKRFGDYFLDLTQTPTQLDDLMVFTF
ncbi:MAG: Tn3 family transposase [Crocosphaera sp.]|uniref:Tn3 family transposase n=2 Tax=Crocosphaera sp. TaxID=2729996 RepID=UPI00258B5DA7|nr:Tn3 family transposase [Crocosphaera sp.]MCH2232455.1 Tn3 family transposase [Crocinitomicaceae bacterium]MCH2245394.1 Tn3 family transposase [Crocosphaera sp.]